MLYYNCFDLNYAPFWLPLSLSPQVDLPPPPPPPHGEKKLDGEKKVDCSITPVFEAMFFSSVFLKRETLSFNRSIQTAPYLLSLIIYNMSQNIL